MNRTLIATVLGVLVIIALMYWNGSLVLPTGKKQVSDAIPKNALAVFQFNDILSWNDMMQSRSYNQELNKFDWFGKLESGSRLFQQLIDAEQINIRQQFAASLHMVGADEYDFLYVLPASKLSKNPFKLFRNALRSDGVQIETSRFKNTVIYNATTPVNGFKHLSFTRSNGLILFSNDMTLVEDGIAALKSGNNIEDEVDVKRMKTKQAINRIGVLTYFENFDLLSPELESDDNAIGKLAKMGSAFSGDVILDEDRLVLNGDINTDDIPYLEALGRYKPEQCCGLAADAPKTTKLLYRFSATNVGTFMADYAESTDRELAYDPDQLNAVLANQWIVGETSTSATPYAMLSVKDESGFKGMFKIDQSKSEFTLNNWSLVQFLFPPSYKDKFDKVHATLKSGKLLMACSEADLEELKNAVYSGKTLNQEEAFNDFKNNLALANNMMIYSKPVDNPKWLSTFIPGLRSDAINAVEQFYPVIFQAYKGKKGMFLNGVAGYQGQGFKEKMSVAYKAPKRKSFIPKEENGVAKNIAEKTGGLFGLGGKKKVESKWTGILGADPIISDHAFKNHNTGASEVFVQTDNKAIHLIDAANKVLWQRSLASKINEPVHNVDIYNNNKLQLLFASEKYIYLVDRLGRDVKGFPVMVESGASNGLARVEYKDVNKVRYFVAGNNGVLMAYDKEGKRLDGFAPEAKVGDVNLPLVHFTSAGKDYLTIVNDEGKVFFFNRRGELRAPVAHLPEGGIERIEKSKSSNIGYLIAHKNGKKWRIDVDGSVAGI